MTPLLAAVEMGGTKVLAAIARDPLSPLRSTRIPTEDPAATLQAVGQFFSEASAEFGPPAALGIGAFGPIDIRQGSPTWGQLGSTPKPGWPGVDLPGRVGQGLDCPVALDTDVNAAALAEARWGAGQGLGTIVYLTVGTGIGGGIVIEGGAVHGALHPEIGHVRLKRHPDDSFPSICSFHEDCAEGLASGPAIAARLGSSLSDLPRDHPFRAILADYLGQLCATLVLVVSPERIIIGGGVMNESGLHAEVERAALRWLNGYVEPPLTESRPFVVPPQLGDGAGLAGAFALAQDLAETRR